MPFGILSFVFYHAKRTVKTGYRITQYALTAYAVRHDDSTLLIINTLIFKNGIIILE